ncbi:MAG: PAS domain S-box protein [Nitrospirales bacterium]
MFQTDRPHDSLEVLDYLPQGIFSLRPDWTVSFWNQCLEEWTKIPRNTILGSPLGAHFPHLATPKYTSRLEPLFQGGPPAIFASKFHPQFIPCTLPNGQRGVQHTIAKSFWHDSAQEWHALVIIADISDLHRQVHKSQQLQKQTRLEMAERKHHEQLLEAIRQVEATIISIQHPHDTFEEVLTQILTITKSTYGFLGEICYRSHFPYLKTYAFFNRARQGMETPFHRLPREWEFTSFNPLFGRVLTTGQHVITNVPPPATGREELPNDHPPLNNFLGLPIYYRMKLVGMVGLANRPQGYDHKLVEYLQPLLASCGRIIQTFRNDQDHQAGQIALIESETRLHLAVSGTNDGLWDWMDVEKDEQWWSPHYYELLGYTSREISPTLTTYKSLIHPDDFQPTFTALQNHFQFRTPFNLVSRLRTKSGKFRWFRTRGTVLRDESGHPTRMAGSLEDITESREREQQLRTLSDRLVLATASAKIGIWDWDVPNNTLNWDQKMLELYGLPAHEFCGAYETWTKGLHPDDRARAEHDVQMALEGKHDFKTEFRVVWPDQSVHIMAAHGLVQRDTMGNPIRMIGANWDITERKEAEENQAHLGHILDESLNELYIFHADTMQFIEVNQSGRVNLGYSMEELRKLTPIDVNLEFTRATFQEILRPLYTGKRKKIELSTYHQRKNGSRYPVEVHLQLSNFHSSKVFVAMILDLTQRKKAEEAKANLQRAIDQGMEGLALLDREGKYTYMNPAIAEMYGYRAEELLGKSWKQLYSKRQLIRLEKECFPMLRNSGRWHGELLGLRKDGTDFPIEISLSLLTSPDGAPAGLVCTCRDITERKKAEQAITQATQALEQKNHELSTARDEALAAARSKAEFLATMSHEIRTPLNGVIGMIGLLLDSPLDPDQREMAKTVQHSGAFLLNIINDILDFSKIDAGKLDLEVIDFDLRTAIDEVLDILAERANSKGLELNALIYTSTPIALRGDPGRIRQVLFNLVGNAIKFTDHGEVVVEVTVHEKQQDTIMIKFVVRDTGIGLTPEAQSGLFESFSQADSSTTRKFGGTGLGLAICKRLVTLMGGNIGLMSNLGHGSEFWFTIPLAQQSTPLPSPSSCSTLQGRRLCIVESHDTVRSILQHYAHSWGMVCEVAKTHAEGLGLLQSGGTDGEPFDAAIFNQTMYEVIKEKGLSLGETIRNTSLVLLTTLGQHGEIPLPKEGRLNGYLTKPVTQHQLFQCLNTVLGKESVAFFPGEAPSPKLITRHTFNETPAKSRLRVLVAEDNVVNQKVAVRMLEKLGYRVDLVSNGFEAVEALRHTAYDIVLMDCQMPEMDGFSATRLIREAEDTKREGANTGPEGIEGANHRTPSSLHYPPEAFPLTPSDHSPDSVPRTNRVPIIAITANALEGDREKCLEAGMDDFLAKPVRLEELEAALHRWKPMVRSQDQHDQSLHSEDSANAPPAASTNSHTAAENGPSLDQAILEELRELGGEDDPEFLEALIELFLQDLPRHLEAIQQAIANQDASALTRAAHTCKGSSHYIGALPLAEICLALETLGRQDTTVGADPLLENFQRERDRLTEALKDLSHVSPP